MIAFLYYLLKVMICSGLLFCYYHIALRNKLFHQWNRFYLLATIVLSLTIPCLEVNIWDTSRESTVTNIQLLQVKIFFLWNSGALLLIAAYQSLFLFYLSWRY